MNKIGFILTVAVHYFIFSGLLVSLLMCWFVLPWYLACTVAATVVRLATSREMCPLTALENKFRRKLHMAESTGFLKDWILRPLKTKEENYYE